jgi:hypothetical protein
MSTVSVDNHQQAEQGVNPDEAIIDELKQALMCAKDEDGLVLQSYIYYVYKQVYNHINWSCTEEERNSSGRKMGNPD